MRSPTRVIAGNLRFTREGAVWADWLLQPLPYGFRPDKEKDVVRAAHQALLRALPGESLLQGICTDLDPVAVVESMISGLDLDAHPDWAAECEATLDTLADISPGQRTFWLSVPLSGAAAGAREALRAGSLWIHDALALPAPTIPSSHINNYLAQAARIAAAIPAVFEPQPATAAQMVWLHQHAQQRGLRLGSNLPPNPDHSTAAPGAVRTGGGLRDPLLDEGGQSDLSSRARGLNPLKRRYLKVTEPAGDPQDASYQTMLVLTDVPTEGMAFPGSEFLGNLDLCGLDVDWAMRLHVRSATEVAKRNRRALNNLADQFNQRDGEVSHAANTLDRIAADLAEYTSILSEDKLEVEVQATIIFAVSAPNPTEVTARAQALTATFGAGGFKLTAPTGEQEDLWWAMQPGVPTNRVSRSYAQITTSHGLSCAVPLASAALGDTKGSLLGFNISTGRTGVVMHDIAGAATKDASGSLAIAGELGSGKSLTLKKLAGDALDRGARIIAIDRTQMGEYVSWARAHAHTAVVDVAAPAYSLDPLRLFDPVAAGRITQSFLTPLLNISPLSELGVLLSETLAPAYLAEHGLRGLGHLRRHLTTDCRLPGAAELARTMGVFARLDFGRVIFDETLPPLPAAPGVVIRTHVLELPSRDELAHAHLFSQLSLEKLFGRALYALAATLAKTICFADRSQLAIFLVDEAHHVTASPEGELALKDFIRDGRKHAAATLLGSQDPDADFGSKTLRGLIPTRLLMRQRDRDLAQSSLAWLGLDPTDPALLDLVTKETSPLGPDGVPEHRRGEAFMRDFTGNIGRVKVLAPCLPTRNLSVRTSPPPANQTHADPATPSNRARSEMRPESVQPMTSRPAPPRPSRTEDAA